MTKPERNPAIPPLKWAEKLIFGSDWVQWKYFKNENKISLPNNANTAVNRHINIRLDIVDQFCEIKIKFYMKSSHIRESDLFLLRYQNAMTNMAQK